MKLLKEIIAQWGNVDAEQCQELACYFPETPLIIKWGLLPREEVIASQVPHRISFVEKMQGDYCREVFYKSRELPKAQRSFGGEAMKELRNQDNPKYNDR